MLVHTNPQIHLTQVELITKLASDMHTANFEEEESLVTVEFILWLGLIPSSYVCIAKQVEILESKGSPTLLQINIWWHRTA
jgi:hypothetical protein